MHSTCIWMTGLVVLMYTEFQGPRKRTLETAAWQSLIWYYSLMSDVGAFFIFLPTVFLLIYSCTWSLSLVPGLPIGHLFYTSIFMICKKSYASAHMKLSKSMFIFFLKPFPHITYHTTQHVEVSGQWLCCIWGGLANPYQPNNSYHSGLRQILQSIKNNCIYGHGHYYELSVVPGKLCSWFLLVCPWEI